MTAPATADPHVNDQLLLIDEIAELTRMAQQTIRWKRHRNELPFLFKRGTRLVAWKSDVLAYLDGLQAADQAARQEASR